VENIFFSFVSVTPLATQPAVPTFSMKEQCPLSLGLKGALLVVHNAMPYHSQPSLCCQPAAACALRMLLKEEASSSTLCTTREPDKYCTTHSDTTSGVTTGGTLCLQREGISVQSPPLLGGNPVPSQCQNNLSHSLPLPPFGLVWVLKGLVHPKMKILSVFTHPHVVPTQ